MPPTDAWSPRTTSRPSDCSKSRSGRLLRTLGPSKPRLLLFSACFSPDGQTVAVHDGDLYLYETATGRERVRIASASVPRFSQQMFQGMHFSPDGTKLVTFGLPSACLWDAHDGRSLGELDAFSNPMREDIKKSGPGTVGEGSHATFSPDGRRILAFQGPSLGSSGLDLARIWDVETAAVWSSCAVMAARSARRCTAPTAGGSSRPRQTGPLVSGTPRTAASWHGSKDTQALFNGALFSPDAQVVLTYGRDRSVRLWAGTTGRAICTLVRHDLGIESAGFSRDGRLLFVSFAEMPSLTRFWPVDFLAAARARRPREPTPAERVRFELAGRLDLLRSEALAPG